MASRCCRSFPRLWKLAVRSSHLPSFGYGHTSRSQARAATHEMCTTRSTTTGRSSKRVGTFIFLMSCAKNSPKFSCVEAFRSRQGSLSVRIVARCGDDGVVVGLKAGCQFYGNFCRDKPGPWKTGPRCSRCHSTWPQIAVLEGLLALF